jgi:hypothetical protein
METTIKGLMQFCPLKDGELLSNITRYCEVSGKHWFYDNFDFLTHKNLAVISDIIKK